MDFFQDPPRLGNQYDDDPVLRSWLRRVLPADVHDGIAPGLRELGGRAAGDLLALAEAAEREPPRHVPFDAWGRRVDRIDTSEAWRALDRVAAEEGIVATAYERTHGAHARVHQLARLYLYHPSSAIYSCPLAMTDGAARTLERLGGDDPYLREVFDRLTTRDAARFWTSGQWMTERSGGSDVSGTRTVARLRGDGAYALTGAKWFTSATTSQVALTLARIVDGEGGDDAAPTGGAGLSLFLVQLRDASGALRGIRVDRLKDKLGTRALPTAELTLCGTPARLVGGAGHGVRKIATLLNVTRLYNAVCAVANMRRAIALAADYATRRVAFGRPLAALPLHVETLAAMVTEFTGGFQLTFHVGELLGREECGVASTEELLLLRLLTPVAKLYTAKQAITVTSEALEAFGGAGYIEDTGLPRLLRDTQVLSIWEGTTNVLSLDVLRALAAPDTLAAFGAAVRRRLDAVSDARLRTAASSVAAALLRIEAHAAAEMEAAERDAAARSFAYALARTYAAALLLEHAAWSIRVEAEPAAARATAAAVRWCGQELAPIVAPEAARLAATLVRGA
ncbi:MAG TPA: acyl-CoA dehydrogenase family protein [Gemmatimonadaceae bacterium]|nr:acyl-CoA dehydrogenase family protein [Gemmatimonadaceae bacterium]